MGCEKQVTGVVGCCPATAQQLESQIHSAKTPISGGEQLKHAAVRWCRWDGWPNACAVGEPAPYATILAIGPCGLSRGVVARLGRRGDAGSRGGGAGGLSSGNSGATQSGKQRHGS
jgi:hypothetical protein